jgi:hypothetical protein
MPPCRHFTRLSDEGKDSEGKHENGQSRPDTETPRELFEDGEWSLGIGSPAVGLLQLLQLHCELSHDRGRVEVKEGRIAAQRRDEVYRVGQETFVSRSFEYLQIVERNP